MLWCLQDHPLFLSLGVVNMLLEWGVGREGGREVEGEYCIFLRLFSRSAVASG